jgi:hypothetical protein
LLLSDVAPCGQGMRYLTGTHVYHWNALTQAGTKFTLDEGLALSRPAGGMHLCWGHAGTCWVFDSNGIHSGHRGHVPTRDVITLSFTRSTPSSHTMFEPELFRDLPALWDSAPRAAVPTDLPCAAEHKSLQMPCCDLCSAQGNLSLRAAAATTSDTDACGPARVSHVAGPLSPRAVELVHAMYNQAPLLQDLRAALPRSYRRRGYLSLADACSLLSSAAADVNADVDLACSAWPGMDKLRDNALVRVRDQPTQAPQYRFLLDVLCAERALFVSSPVMCTISQFAAEASSLDVAELLCHTNLDLEFKGCRRLLQDLSVASTHCDTAQRERSTAIFVAFSLHWLMEILFSLRIPEPTERNVSLAATKRAGVPQQPDHLTPLFTASERLGINAALGQLCVVRSIQRVEWLCCQAMRLYEVLVMQEDL